MSVNYGHMLQLRNNTEQLLKLADAPDPFHVAPAPTGWKAAHNGDGYSALSAVRSRGNIRLSFKSRDAGTTIDESYQSGCLRLRMPSHLRGSDPEVVLLNTSGGLAEGDRLSQHIRWEAGSTATVTTQAAEKVYRSRAAAATVETRIDVGANAHAEWLPQETILFNHARFSRDTQVRLDADASFLGVEAVVFGRAAMNEVVREGLLADRWRIWRTGRLVYADSLRLEGPIETMMRRAAIGAGAHAIGTIIHVSSRAADLLRQLRDALTGTRGHVAASAWNGLLVVRFLAGCGAALRDDLISVLAVLRGSHALPRVWSC